MKLKTEMKLIGENYINRMEILRQFNDSVDCLFKMDFSNFPHDFAIITSRKISQVTIYFNGEVRANFKNEDGKYSCTGYKFSDMHNALSFVIKKFNTEW